MMEMIDEKETISILEKQLTYLFITRDVKIFERQISLLNTLKSEIIKTKNEFISQQNENEANKWLSIENLCFAFLEGLRLFLELKNNNPDNAWNFLISAQNHSSWSNDGYLLSSEIQHDCIVHFNSIESVLFPAQTFMSVSMIVESSECSICSKEFSECEHIRGDSYMGKSCTEITTKINRVNHVAIVTHPDDKRCRITHYGNTEPPTINKMTLLDESKNKKND